MASEFPDRFINDVSLHEMRVIRDDGVYRHLRFARPESSTMYFDMITWPGCLCYTGDMGTYVFRRTTNMFQFFRRNGERKYEIDFRYWAEKTEASDRDGVSEYSDAKFVSCVKEYFDDHIEDHGEEDREKDAKLWQEIEDQVLIQSDDEHAAFAALHYFEHDDFRFYDWESSCKVWTHRFLWCCHALVWAISVYDAMTPSKPVELSGE